LVTEFRGYYVHTKVRNWQQVKKNVQGEDSKYERIYTIYIYIYK